MMGRRRSAYEEDDGRTIADMSQVGAGFGSPKAHDGQAGGQRREREAAGSEDRSWEDSALSGRERRMYIWGALRAGLLIALVYIAGFGLLIGLLLWLWS